MRSIKGSGAASISASAGPAAAAAFSFPASATLLPHKLKRASVRSAALDWRTRWHALVRRFDAGLVAVKVWKGSRRARAAWGSGQAGCEGGKWLRRVVSIR
jgi:hypothetical protein